MKSHTEIFCNVKEYLRDMQIKLFLALDDSGTRGFTYSTLWGITFERRIRGCNMSRQLLLETVSACNLRCKMCAHVERMTGKSLEKRKILEILRDVHRFNNINPTDKFLMLRLDGNTEPLLYKDIKWLLQENRKISSLSGKLDVGITTNGLLLDSDIVRCLLEKNVRIIQISATGLTSDVYREFQGSNLPENACEKNLNAVKSNIISLISMKKKMNAETIIELRYIISMASVDEFIPYLEYWRGQGADRICVGGMGDGTLKAESRAMGRTVSYKSCSRFGKIIVRATGDVILSCCDYEMHPVGNIYKQSFFDIMTSPTVAKYEKAHRELDIANLPRICVNCPDMRVYDKANFETRQDFSLGSVERYKKEFLNMASSKKLIVWGAGAEFEHVREKYLRDHAIAYVVDSEYGRWNSFVNGLEIRSPDALKSEDCAGTVVLIATSSFFSIQQRLSALGIQAHYASPLFLDRYFPVDGHTADVNTIPLR